MVAKMALPHPRGAAQEWGTPSVGTWDLHCHIPATMTPAFPDPFSLPAPIQDWVPAPTPKHPTSSQNPAFDPARC